MIKSTEVCPKCGYAGGPYTKVRQYKDHPGVADVGYECPKCGLKAPHELSEAATIP